MRAGILAGLGTFLLLLTGGCAISPPPEVQTGDMCRFQRHELRIVLPGEAVSGTDQEGQSFAAELDAVYARPRPEGVSNSMLFLSGGSQHGAFGAGFLDGWSRRRTEAGKQGLPDFRVVTGISTGSILSTWAFIDDTATLARNYRIQRENQVLQPYAKPGSDFSTAMAIARRGAVADLSPLRAQLRAELTDAVLERVAAEGRRDRRLYVGAVDLDHGQAVIFDLTHMAQKFVDEPARRELYRNCYAEAIIASSSVPMAAPPAFIDNRMYIDGGARFGVFSDQLGAVIDPGAQIDTPGGPPHHYILVNGDLAVSDECRKLDPAQCRPPPNDLAGLRQDWRFPQLATRSLSILVNQTYRSSVERIMRQRGPNIPLLEYIQPRLLAEFSTALDNPAWGTEAKLCSQWREDDDRIDHPVEFHPRYMNCLVAFGDSRAGATRWHLLE